MLGLEPRIGRFECGQKPTAPNRQRHEIRVEFETQLPDVVPEVVTHPDRIVGCRRFNEKPDLRRIDACTLNRFRRRTDAHANAVESTLVVRQLDVRTFPLDEVEGPALDAEVLARPIGVKRQTSPVPSTCRVHDMIHRHELCRGEPGRGKERTTAYDTGKLTDHRTLLSTLHCSLSVYEQARTQKKQQLITKSSTGNIKCLV